MTNQNEFDYDLSEIELRARKLRAQAMRHAWNAVVLRLTGLFSEQGVTAKTQA